MLPSTVQQAAAVAVHGCGGSGGVCASGASGGGSYLLAMLPLSANSRITCASCSVNQYKAAALPNAR
ncbi:hypothetical protein Hamer_G004836 [Homarus americanus]|uniref:Uncharacterized protein n=1 Tax=Homarus americanus TaxID=6706 RepID=A0A8J5K1Z1_HOMAM|nr:hypothetical protein Hamer_G004836 [Homarus americanus]